MEKALTVGDQSTTIYYPDSNAAGGPPVLLLHPWWGLNPDVKALADRLAEAGFSVAAPDLFRGRVVTNVKEAEQMVKTFDDGFGEAATTGALDALLAESGSKGPAAVIGLSFGAAWAIWLSAQRPEIGAVVLYYGTWVGPILAESEAPILGHFAESDPFEDAETVAALEATCRHGRPTRGDTRLSRNRPLVCGAITGRLRARCGGSGLRADPRVPAPAARLKAAADRQRRFSCPTITFTCIRTACCRAPRHPASIRLVTSTATSRSQRRAA